MKKKKIFNYISLISKKLNYKTYLIGGYVRNYLLNKKKSLDIDIVTTGNSIKLAKYFSKKILTKKIFFFKRFKTAIVKYKDYNIEFVSTRKEYYNIYNNKPTVKIYKSIIEDQNRRDFTINSIAISLNIKNYGKIIDTFNGLKDLKKKKIRTPLNPNITFYDDPLRMIRAIRFSSQLNFKLNKKLKKAIIENIDRIRIISIERIIQEFNKILLSKKPSIGLKLMFNLGFLSIILPELIPFKNKFKNYFIKNIFIKILKLLDNIKTNNLWLKWAILLQYVGKPICKKYIKKKKKWNFKLYEIVSYNMIPKIFIRLKLPMNKKMKYVQNIIKYSNFFIKILKKKEKKYIIKKIFLKLNNKIIKDIIKLCYNNIIVNNKKNIKIKFKKLLLIIKKIKKKKIKININGNDIKNILNIKTSKRVGIIKNKIIKLIIKNNLKNNYKCIYKKIIDINNNLNGKK